MKIATYERIEKNGEIHFIVSLEGREVYHIINRPLIAPELSEKEKDFLEQSAVDRCKATIEKGWIYYDGESKYMIECIYCGKKGKYMPSKEREVDPASPCECRKTSVTI